jgi:protocatechuate 3,4-dioxygenase beta subunit
MTLPDHRFTRRHALRGLGGAGVGLAGRGLFGPRDFEDAAVAATPSCTLAAEQEQGPYYLDLERIRKNITEGKRGLRVDSTSCEPLPNVAVDIWHCAADGHYSGFAREGTSGETFLRGVQLTDENGVAAFRTIYPGWYQGRATHIHLKAHVGGTRSGAQHAAGHVAHTGQLFFSDSLTDRVAELSPYGGRARTRNRVDHIYTQQHGASALLSISQRNRSSLRSGVIGRITLGVDPDATPASA